ncbi:nodulation efficiency NfeD family protein [Neisseria animaloris]|uniref:NfeD family protein n=1 Tax=Neisseria animaloris TaxID=326522 RepID=UPI000A1907F1|nr:NfeD family protein [Neisseria animaloris]OSI08418.1 nodulation efficiency NfeD family protein [Neisseria animaloris]VEH86809.1 nodulation efficiency NfeD family protein [Neisseria animaloris]
MIAWFIAAILVLILELFVGTIYLLVVSAALFGAGIAAWLFDSLSISIVTAAALSAVGIWWAHGWIKKHRRPPVEESARNDLDIGQTVQINRHLHGNLYEVHYRGTVWHAQADNGADHAAGQTAVITGKNGNILLIHLHSSSN